MFIGRHTNDLFTVSVSNCALTITVSAALFTRVWSQIGGAIFITDSLCLIFDELICDFVNRCISCDCLSRAGVPVRRRSASDPRSELSGLPHILTLRHPLRHGRRQHRQAPPRPHQSPTQGSERPHPQSRRVSTLPLCYHLCSSLILASAFSYVLVYVWFCILVARVCAEARGKMLCKVIEHQRKRTGYG